jgi:capsular polysaccharide biosynthesis protein
VWGAVRSNIVLVVIVVLVCTAAGAALGMRRHAKFSATANLAVLHLNFGGSQGSLNAFSTAGPILADTYARSIDADGVVAPLAKEFHTSQTTIRTDLSAASVPASPMLMVTAKTTSSATSIALANAAMAQLVKYLGGVNGSDPAVATLYDQLKAADATLAAEQAKLEAVKANINHALQTSKAVSMSASQQAQLSAAQSAETLASNEAASLDQAYTEARLNGSNTQYLQPLQSATTAKSDRTSRLVLYGFVGLAVGIALATGIAVPLQGRKLKKLRAA